MASVRKTIYQGLEITHNRRKRVGDHTPLAGGKYTILYRWEADGQERVTYRVDMDISTLEAMAHKAAGSKGGKCQDGPLLVTVTGRKRL